MRRAVIALPLLVLAALVAPTAQPSVAVAADCPDPETIEVPAAEFLQAVCLEDLTTLGNARTDTGASTGAGSRGNGSIHTNLTAFTSEPVPGLQIEGWFPDSCDRYAPENNTFIPPCENGMRHNGQFLIRIPNDWDGEHLVVAGTPGVRTQFASDVIISDFVLARGWAYATQDKGNTGLNFFRAGDDETGGSANEWIPGAAIEQWAPIMAATAVAAEGVLAEHYGGPPSLTYATGISNGGYQTRVALEQFPEIFDGGVDWEGTLLQPQAPNLFTYLPPALDAYPAYKAGDGAAYDQIVHQGRMPPDSEPIWDNHWAIYWGLVQSTYRPEFDPEYSGYVDSPRVVVPPDPDAAYDYEARPDFVGERIEPVTTTGETNDRPLLTLHGTLDALLPIDTDSDVYAERVRAAGNGASHRYYVVENGTHVDKLQESHPALIQPILPCYLDALDALDAWVVAGDEPPPSGFVPFDAERTPAERANACDLPSAVDRVAGPDRITTAIAGSRGGFGISASVVLAAAGDFADALAAAPLATRLEAPILLVGDELTAELRTELHRTGALEAVVVGGTAAVPESVTASLEEAGLSVRRVSGPDRFATAAAVATEVGAAEGEAFVASGRSFADALAAAPVAARLGIPILLTEPGSLPAATAAALDELGVERTTVMGGQAAVASDVLDELPDATRVAGPTRYATAVAAAEMALERGLSLEQVGIATGRGFADALSAGPVLATGYGGAPGGGVVLLVDPGTDDAAAFVSEHRGDVGQLLVFGGEAAVPASVVPGGIPHEGGDGPAPTEPPSEPAGDDPLGTTFPEDFPVPVDASLGVPVIGFGAAGPVTRPPVLFLHGNNDTPYPTDCNAGFGKIHAMAQAFLDAGWSTSELWGFGPELVKVTGQGAYDPALGTAHLGIVNSPDVWATAIDFLS